MYKQKGNTKKKYEGSLPCTNATAGEDVSHTNTHQAKLIISFTSLRYSEGKEENYSFPFSLVTYIQMNIYF